jgi:hypothetical protein
LEVEKRLIKTGEETTGAQMVEGVMGNVKVEQEEVKREATAEAERKGISCNQTFKRICVFCGSSSGYKDIFSDVALSLGRELVSNIPSPPSQSSSINFFHQVLNVLNLVVLHKN